jgi:plastocyanin
MDSTKASVALSGRAFSAPPLKALGVVLSLLLLLPGALQAKAETIEIAVKDIAFAPAEVQAKVGDTIRWQNRDPAPHTATAEGLFDVSVPVGGSGETVVGQPGSIDYHCTLHPDMRGRITVAPR